MRCGWGPYFRRTFEVQAGNSPLQGQSKPPAKLVVLICIATSQSPSLLRTLTTAYNLGMCLLALPMIYVQSQVESQGSSEITCGLLFSVNEKERFVWERYPIYGKRLM